MRKLSISELCMKLVTLIFIRLHIKPFGECRTHAASGQCADNVITINIFYEVFYRRPITSTSTIHIHYDYIFFFSRLHTATKNCDASALRISLGSPTEIEIKKKKTSNFSHWNRWELFQRSINKNRIPVRNEIKIENFTWTNAHTTSSCSMCRMDCDYIFSILPRNSNTINT